MANDGWQDMSAAGPPEASLDPSERQRREDARQTASAIASTSGGAQNQSKKRNAQRNSAETAPGVSKDASPSAT